MKETEGVLAAVAAPAANSEERRLTRGLSASGD